MSKKCKCCGRTIPDDREYCYPCEDENDSQFKKGALTGGGVVAIGFAVVLGIIHLFGKD